MARPHARRGAVLRGDPGTDRRSRKACDGNPPPQGSASAPKSGATSKLAAGRLVVGAIAYENGTLTLAGDSDVAGGSWSTKMTLNNGTAGATGVGVTRQLKWVTASSAQTYDSATSTGTGENWTASIFSVV